RFRDEDAGVVDQRIDAAELFNGRVNDALCDGGVGNVPRHADHVARVVRPRLDVSRIRNDAVAAPGITTDEPRADPLGSARYDHNLRFLAHDDLPFYV